MILERPASLRGHLCVLGERCALWAPGQLDRHNPRQSLPLLSLHITPRSTSDYPSSHGGTCLHPSHTPALLKECRHRSHRHSPPSPPWFPWTRTLPIYRRSHLFCLRVPIWASRLLHDSSCKDPAVHCPRHTLRSQDSRLRGAPDNPQNVDKQPPECHLGRGTSCLVFAAHCAQADWPL
jgi:hypothetical protein